MIGLNFIKTEIKTRIIVSILSKKVFAGTKKLLLLCFGTIFFLQISKGQVLCIFCYDQNEAISPDAINLLTNGSFESGCMPGGVFCPNSNTYDWDLSGWNCTGGGALTYANMFNDTYTIIPDGLLAAYFGNSLCHVCNGPEYDTTCLIQSECITTGVPDGYPINTIYYGDTTGVTLVQTVTGMIPGNNYILEFWAGGETVPSYYNDGFFAIDIGFGNTYLRCPTSGPPDYIGRRFLIEFVAISEVQTIKFTSWGHISYFNTELILDDIRLYTEDELPKSATNCFPTILIYNDIETLMVYPNPFKDEINLLMPGIETSTIILFDLQQRVLLKKTFSGNTPINTSMLPPNVYFYLITENGLKHTGIIIKE